MKQRVAKCTAMVLAATVVCSGVLPADMQAAKKPSLTTKQCQVTVGKTVKLNTKNVAKKTKVTFRYNKMAKKTVTLKWNKKKKQILVRGKRAGKATVQVRFKKGRRTWKYNCKIQVAKKKTAVTPSAAPEKPTQAPTSVPVTTAPAASPSASAQPTGTPAPTPVPGNVIGSTFVVGNHAMVMMLPEEETVQQGYTEPVAGQETDGEPQNITAETEDGKIPEWKYYRNQSVGAVSIPEGTTEIGRFAFSRSSLRTVTIPEGVTVIDYAAFYHCDNLDNVILPDTVNTVGAKAFTHTGWLDDFEENSMDDFLISGDILVAYKGNLPEVVIPDGVRVIAEEAFRNHTELKKVHLPASVTDIGNDAFPEGIEIINE